MIPTPPSWQLPDGVSPGTWDYANQPAIATGYDEYFAGHPLFQLDQSLLLENLPPAENVGTTVADLGCGTGRALAMLAEHGYRGLAIDLSQHMLQMTLHKANDQQLPIVAVRANLVDLNGLRDACVDHAVSLFSTLGMVRGRRFRVEALRQTWRILKPSGCFILHVHNLWSAMYDPGGFLWHMKSWWTSRGQPDVDWGDRIYPYRGLPNMFLHNYRLSELKHDLHSAGFRIVRIYPVSRTAGEIFHGKRCLPRLRAGGWIAVCRKPD